MERAEKIRFLLDLIGQEIEGIVRETIAAGPSQVKAVCEGLGSLPDEIRAKADALRTYRQMLVNVIRSQDETTREWNDIRSLVKVEG